MDDSDASTFSSDVAVVKSVVQQQSPNQSNTQIKVRFALEYQVGIVDYILDKIGL